MDRGAWWAMVHGVTRVNLAIKSPLPPIVVWWCLIEEGVEHGDYKLYEGFDYPVIEGVYVHGKRNGEWQVRDDRGKLVEVLKYDNGVLLNDKELKKEYSKSFDENEAKKGKFIEPDRMLDAQ